jgi:hypothetical protein
MILLRRLWTSISALCISVRDPGRLSFQINHSCMCQKNYDLNLLLGAASWSSGQSFWLLIIGSRVRFPALSWGFFFEGEDCHGDHGLGSLVELRLRPLLVLHIHVSPPTSSGQRNCASWMSQPQNSVTLWPQPGGEATKSVRDIWWHWKKNCYWYSIHLSIVVFLVYILQYLLGKFKRHALNVQVLWVRYWTLRSLAAVLIDFSNFN